MTSNVRPRFFFRLADFSGDESSSMEALDDLDLRREGEGRGGNSISSSSFPKGILDKKSKSPI
jgi:hypothetical protein